MAAPGHDLANLNQQIIVWNTCFQLQRPRLDTAELGQTLEKTAEYKRTFDAFYDLFKLRGLQYYRNSMIDKDPTNRELYRRLWLESQSLLISATAWKTECQSLFNDAEAKAIQRANQELQERRWRELGF
ncbi:MAG: hypothetical protein Q9184_003596 [Pyrenodesmia sp. 2 TL-2023]